MEKATRYSRKIWAIVMVIMLCLGSFAGYSGITAVYAAPLLPVGNNYHIDNDIHIKTTTPSALYPLTYCSYDYYDLQLCCILPVAFDIEPTVFPVALSVSPSEPSIYVVEDSVYAPTEFRIPVGEEFKRTFRLTNIHNPYRIIIDTPANRSCFGLALFGGYEVITWDIIHPVINLPPGYECLITSGIYISSPLNTFEENLVFTRHFLCPITPSNLCNCFDKHHTAHYDIYQTALLLSFTPTDIGIYQLRLSASADLAPGSSTITPQPVSQCSTIAGCHCRDVICSDYCVGMYPDPCHCDFSCEQARPPSSTYAGAVERIITFIVSQFRTINVTTPPPGGGTLVITYTPPSGTPTVIPPANMPAPGLPGTISVPDGSDVVAEFTPSPSNTLCEEYSVGDWQENPPNSNNWRYVFTVDDDDRTIAPVENNPGHRVVIDIPPYGEITIIHPGGTSGPFRRSQLPDNNYVIYVPDGAEITVIVTPDAGRQVHPNWNNGNQSQTLTISGPTTVTPLLMQIPGQDIDDGDDAYAPANEVPPRPDPLPLAEADTAAPGQELVQWHWAYVIGYPDGTFQADNPMTRAEMVQVFFNLLDSASRYTRIYNRFPDVSQTDWFYPAIAYFVNIGALSGFPDGSFRPNIHITNAEFASFAVNFFNLGRFGIMYNVEDIEGHWAETAIRIGFDAGWFAYFGEDYIFDPDAPITRAQAVTLLNHYTGRIPNRNDIALYLGTTQRFTDVDRSHWAFYEIMEASISHHFIRRDDVEHWILP
ncbi:MAG: S-layer homology domain-containing protein [Oscillospiraceae bacterium]|nr:S-layer homology domain-containing protein [Oscillospiraceae bacterium]